MVLIGLKGLLQQEGLISMLSDREYMQKYVEKPVLFEGAYQSR